MNYDPVREAAAHNAADGTYSDHTNSTGGGSSQPQGGENPSADGIRSDTDTKRLGDHLSQYGRGVPVYLCGIEDTRNATITTPQRHYFSRIWAHVKAEHPEYSDHPQNPKYTINSNTLINNIYNLNKNYPGN